MIGYKDAVGVITRACDRMVRRGDVAYQGSPKVLLGDKAPCAVIAIQPGPDNLITGSQTEFVDVVDTLMRRVWLTVTVEHFGDAVVKVVATDRRGAAQWVANLAADEWPETLVGMIKTAVSNIIAERAIENGRN